jgi:hypothetical protein
LRGAASIAALLVFGSTAVMMFGKQQLFIGLALMIIGPAVAIVLLSSKRNHTIPTIA